MRPERIDQNVALVLVNERIALDFHTGWQRLNVYGNWRGDVFLQAFVHQIQGRADGHGGDGDAHEKPHLLPEGRGADEIAGFQILRGGAGNGGSNANHAANHEREHGIVGRSPSRQEENRAGGHQRRDAHAADRIRGIAEQAADAPRHGDEKKSEHHHKHGREEVLIPESAGPLHGMKG